MIRLAALASGSNGNCYYFGTDKDAILVDAGISCRQIANRLEKLKLDISKIRGIFITHEHIDHIRGVEVLTRKYRLPIFVTKKTFDNSGLYIDEELVNFISIGEMMEIGNIAITPFAKNHDAVEPCSYSLCFQDKKVCIMTDIVTKCKNVITHLADADAVFLETNYDDHMLENGFYPYHLKQRISGDNGHLSNYQAALLVLEHATPKLKYVFLSHLSANNNSPELAYTTFTSMIKERKDLKLKVIKTSRKDVTEIITL